MGTKNIYFGFSPALQLQCGHRPKSSKWDFYRRRLVGVCGSNHRCELSKELREVCPRGPKYVTQFQYKNPSRQSPPPFATFFYLLKLFRFLLPSYLLFFNRLARIHKIAWKWCHWIMDSPKLGHMALWLFVLSIFYVWLSKFMYAYFKKYFNAQILWNSACTVQINL